MIGGREHVLYDTFVGRLQLADIPRLWINSALSWAPVLFAALMTVSLATGTGWAAAGALFVVLIEVPLSFYVRRRDVVTTLFTVVEKEREGSRSTPSLSTRGNGKLIASAHTDMAGFLKGALNADRNRRFTPRREVPVALTDPRTRWHLWKSVAVFATSLAVLAVLVSVTARIFGA